MLQMTNKKYDKVNHWLDKYFPEFNDVFADWEVMAVLISLSEFATPEKVLSTSVKQIVATWKKEVKRAVGNNRAVRLIEAAKISIIDPLFIL